MATEETPAEAPADAPATDVPAEPGPAEEAPAEEEPAEAPPGGDVDVSKVDPGPFEGEVKAAYTVSDWVVLDGAHPDVPDSLDGKIAGILEAPSIDIPGGTGPNAAQMPDPDANILVRVRDDPSNALLSLPAEAFKTVARGGRAELLPIG